MRISDLMVRLEEIVKAHGDLWVEGTDGQLRYVEDVDIVTDRDGEPSAVCIRD